MAIVVFLPSSPGHIAVASTGTVGHRSMHCVERFLLQNAAA